MDWTKNFWVGCLHCWVLCLCLCLCLGPNTSLAAERFEFFNGVRSLGMGGASIAVVNDETALLTNPAGIGKLRDYIFTLIDPEIHMSGPVTGLTSSQAVTNYLDPQPIYDAIAASPGQNFHFAYNLFPSFVAPNFGFGVLYHNDANGMVDVGGTNFHYDTRQDTVPVLGYNFRFWGGRFKLGFSGRYIQRTEGSLDTTPPVSNLDLSTFSKTSAGIGLDLGLIMTAPWKSLPTLAVVVRDYGDTQFNIGGDVGSQATTVPQTVDAALAFFPVGGNRIRYTYTFEMRDILSTSEPDMTRRSHLGFEANLGDILFLRLGYNQNYWTAGVEFATQHLQFQVATYGENIGTAAAPEEDRRYVGKFAFRF